MNLQETKAKLEKYNQSQLLKYYDEYRKIAVFSLKQAKSLGGNGIYFFDIKDYESFLRKEKIKSVAFTNIPIKENSFSQVDSRE